MNSSFGSLARSRLLATPQQIAFTFEEEETKSSGKSYADLFARAVNIGLAIVRHTNRGDRVMLMMQPGLDYVATFLACWLYGVIAVPSYPLRRNQRGTRTLNIISDCQPALVVTDRISNASAPSFCSASLLVEDIPLEAIEPDSLVAIIDRLTTAEDADDIVFLQYTSGSTGSPKGTIVSHGNLMHNSQEMSRKFETSTASTMVSWLPPYHDMGLILGILHPLFVGFPAHLMAPAAFIRKPLDWLRMIARHKATISGGPNFAFDLCVSRALMSAPEPMDLSSWRVAFNGAEPVHPSTLRRFAATFGRYGFASKSLHPCYGLAENTLMVSGQDPSPAIECSSQFIRAPRPGDPSRGETVDCGSSIRDQLIRIVNPDTCMECEEGEVGEIWVAGPSVALGYWGEEEKTTGTFRARLNGAPDARNYLRTGDLGQMLDGKLFIRGRIKDLIIIRGVKFYAQDIERIITDSCEEIRAGGYCAAVQIEESESASLGVVAELARKHRHADTAALTSLVRALVANQYGLRVSRTVFLRPGEFPKTTSGKIPRDFIRRSHFLPGMQARPAENAVSLNDG